MSDNEQTQDNSAEIAAAELDSLKSKANLLGIKFHPSLSAEKLRERISAHLAGEPTDDEPKVEISKTELTPGQKRQKMRQEALKLIRVNIVCLNPAKREWDGEIIAVGNSNLETIKKFVPFNTTDGYHIPHIMYEMLKARECQFFYSERVNGVSVRKGKLGAEFAITVLPPLTQDELDDLAKAQAAAGIIQ